MLSVGKTQVALHFDAGTLLKQAGWVRLSSANRGKEINLKAARIVNAQYVQRWLTPIPVTNPVAMTPRHPGQMFSGGPASFELFEEVAGPFLGHEAMKCLKNLKMSRYRPYRSVRLERNAKLNWFIIFHNTYKLQYTIYSVRRSHMWYAIHSMCCMVRLVIILYHWLYPLVDHRAEVYGKNLWPGWDLFSSPVVHQAEFEAIWGPVASTAHPDQKSGKRCLSLLGEHETKATHGGTWSATCENLR